MSKSKFIRVLMLSLMMLFLAACGDSKEDIAGTIQQSEENSTNQSGETDTAENEEKPVTLGQFEGGIYTNKYLGIECDLDSDWLYYSADELQEIPDAVKEAMGDTDIAESMADVDQVMDMKAENAEELISVNIMYTKVDMTERLTAMAKGEEYVVESVLEQAEMMKEGYEAAGILVNEIKKVNVTFLGEERTAIWTSAVTQEIPYFTLQLFDYSAGKYSATLTFASYLEDKTTELLDLFHEIED